MPRCPVARVHARRRRPLSDSGKQPVRVYGQGVATVAVLKPRVGRCDYEVNRNAP